MNALLRHKKAQSGLTIVELMVSLAIGLILMGGMVQIFKTNKNAYRYNNSLAEMQDNGNYALDFVTNQISQIGFVPDWNGYTPTDINGDEHTNRQDMEIWYYGATAPVIGTEGGGDKSDSITINVFADPNVASPTDCVGTVINAPGDFVSPPRARPVGLPALLGIENALVAIENADTGRFSLTCNEIEVAEGIENMQIVYGVDTADPDVAQPFEYDGRVDKYLKADEIAADEWLNILTVRIALLVASNDQSRTAENIHSYDLVGTEVKTSGDNKQRSVYTTTIRLRNRCAKFSATSPCT